MRTRLLDETLHLRLIGLLDCNAYSCVALNGQGCIVSRNSTFL
jgi:hypothetical protein